MTRCWSAIITCCIDQHESEGRDVGCRLRCVPALGSRTSGAALKLTSRNACKVQLERVGRACAYFRIITIQIQTSRLLERRSFVQRRSREEKRNRLRI